MAQETGGLTKYDEVAEDTAPVRLGETKTADDADEVVSEETVRLHSEIEETRENLGETIDAIQERLSLSNLSEQVSEQVSNVIETAKDSVYDATIGKAVNFMKQAREGVMQTSAGRTIMANPIPFVLIGAGSAMLIYNGFGKKNRRSSQLSKYRTGEYSTPQLTERRAGSMLTGAKETITDKAGTAYETVAKTASDTYETAAEAASRAYERVGELGSSAKENYDYYVEEKPMAVAAAAMAVGAAIGFAIPSTRYEGELMGEARENLLEKAGDTATELVDKAKQVASDASQVISRGTGSQTGTSGNL
jgi:ElaB/YqjD/DUF883 family membrane-anchored ribosome-binding protein